MEVLDVHQQLLDSLEKEMNKEEKHLGFGKLFLQHSPKVLQAHQIYCSLHPLAVCILDIFRDDITKFMESRGAACPGILVLTSMLSKPFRRLDKYSGMLSELEKHMGWDHSDNGNIQKCIGVYKDKAADCNAIRRQKELELQVLTGPICGWEGPNLATFGDIVYMSLVILKCRCRYFVLFPSTLVILSVSHSSSAFVYKKKIYLDGLTVSRLKESNEYKHAFEINSPITENTIVFCQNEKEADHWVHLLCKMSTSKENLMISKLQSRRVLEPTILNQRRYCSNLDYVTVYNYTMNYTPTYPLEDYPSAAPYASLTRHYHALIKNKTITSKLLKHLLYSEYLNKTNPALVRLRHHKTEVYIYTKDESYRDGYQNGNNWDEDSTDNSEEVYGTGRRVQRQNAVHSKSSSEQSCCSNPFGYIRYYNPENISQTEETLYVDDEEHEPKITELPNDILVIPTSMNLPKQISEESQASSGISPQKSYMACEDLCNLDDNTELNTLTVPQAHFPAVRQSCPTKFVGNKFNQTSLTAIYIPPWSNSDNNIKYNNNNHSAESSTHSSTLNLPANTLPLPNKILGELLYGEPVEPAYTDMEVNDERNSLSLKDVEFRKHTINSGKLWERSGMQLHSKAPKRYTSSRFIELSKPDGAVDDSRKPCYSCRSHSRGYCHSIRSSDSGMEGSSIMNFSDIYNFDSCNSFQEHLSITSETKRSEVTSSEIEARNFESECRCTSPFGSTPRTSGQDAAPENILTGSRGSFTSSASLVSSYCHTPLTDIPVISRLGIKKSYSESCILEENARDVRDQSVEPPTIYKSGLYAHWWMKANLLVEVRNGIKLKVPKLYEI
ncbi:unnamed protein product [Acanthoscelides obtectus]|uniref:Rho guanine nucleotide exchange factor 7 n=1 Tax=Acanthoscelides obtectus TaxID=200917 RepID=A0A9P0LH16_ACAOB|nr:unnamed protein product [Acanthoscelides obtectus]CAK1661236.1 Rho guanine nucleotide exchange factor 7 [Acanthoscelides obtectus]